VRPGHHEIQPIEENRRNKSKSCALEIWDCHCVADFPDCAMRGGTVCAGKRERTTRTNSEDRYNLTLTDKPNVKVLAVKPGTG